jgi:hypothetical protein
VRDDFDDADLHPGWISPRHRPADNYTTKERTGWLTLRAGTGSLDDLDGTFIGRRQQHLSCRVRASVDPAEGCGGLAVRLDDRHHCEVEAQSGRVRVVARVGPLRTVLATRPVPDGPLVLRIEVSDPPAGGDARTGPDLLSLGLEEPDGSFAVLATLDGRYLSTEVAGGFTGRVIGPYATAGTVHVDWFDYEPLGTERSGT